MSVGLVNKSKSARTAIGLVRIGAKQISFVILFVLMAVGAASADVKLPAVIGDNMVLQQGRQVAIWGTAEAGEQVTVTLGEQKVAATADSTGNWKVELAPLKKGGPLEMTVAGKNTLTLHNVLVGEVWVCSGQSNMEFAVWNHGVFGGANNAEKEVAAADYPQMRLFIVTRAVAGKKTADRCAGAVGGGESNDRGQLLRRGIFLRAEFIQGPEDSRGPD
jgi:hypothetical protein